MPKKASQGKTYLLPLLVRGADIRCKAVMERFFPDKGSRLNQGRVQEKTSSYCIQYEEVLGQM